jgi:hypothetical protein
MRQFFVLSFIAASLLTVAASSSARANQALVHGESLATTQPRDAGSKTDQRLAYDVDFSAVHAGHAASKG